MNEMQITNFATSSVVEYKDRGNEFGNNKYRGNCSGFFIKDIVNFFKPKLFLDITEGGGTSKDVCKALGIDYVGTDLHKGIDFTKQYLLDYLPRPADVSFSHFPYGPMIKYSGNMWGDKPVEGDTSHCTTTDEFLEMSQVGLMNQREATRDGGVYCTLIGDLKKQGQLTSYQADFIKMMPKDELLNVVIKLQHNTMSGRKTYTANNFIPITHEYCIFWRKKATSIFQIGLEIAKDQTKKVAATWRSVIRIVMMKLKEATLQDIYNEVEKIAGDMLDKNSNWQAKIRQKLQKHHTNVSRGVWAA